MRPACVTRAHGFTLLEVLVALAIVALGMSAVLGTLTSSADTISYLRDKTFANWVALNQIAQVRLSGQTPASGKSDGDLDFAGRKWHWHQEVTALQLPGMARIEVSARPADVNTDSERGWYVTLSGIYGDAVAAPRGDLPSWGSQTLMPPTNTTPGGTPTAPGTSPGTAPGPVPGAPPGGRVTTPPAPQPTATPTTPVGTP